jgi:hypothetical protein
VTPLRDGYRLLIPAGPARVYRLAQLDDYTALSRERFAWGAPIELSLRCRVCATDLPGTWGFGFWNDPFSVSTGLGGTGRRLPALPNAAWFFHASPENQLSLRDDRPASGFLAASMSSPRIPSLLLAPGLLGAPLLLSKTLARAARRLAGKVIAEDGARLALDVTQWHSYRLVWNPHGVEFSVDEETVFETEVSPRGPLGLVLWIDNQFAAFTPAGALRAGALENRAAAWMEIEKVSARTPA